MTRITSCCHESSQNHSNSTHRACFMSEHLANSNARLQTLVTQIMQERDPLTYDALCAELWRVLDEREILNRVEGKSAERARSKAA